MQNVANASDAQENVARAAKRSARELHSRLVATCSLLVAYRDVNNQKIADVAEGADRGAYKRRPVENRLCAGIFESRVELKIADLQYLKFRSLTVSCGGGGNETAKLKLAGGDVWVIAEIWAVCVVVRRLVGVYELHS